MRSPRDAESLVSAAPKGARGPGGAAPQGNPNFNLGVICKRSKSKRPYVTVWNRRTVQLPDLKTWFSLGRCKSWGAALLKHVEPWRLRSQTTAIGDCAPKSLQWLRYLITIQRVTQSSTEATGGVCGRSLEVHGCGSATTKLQRG